MKASVRCAAVSLGMTGVLLGGCAQVPARGWQLGDGGTLGIPGLAACGGGELELDPGRPLVLFVPGRGDPGDRYAELGARFEQDGAQTACFRYDDREALDVSSAQLIHVLEQLEARLEPGRITIVAHSLGGLVARRALIEERADRLRTAPGFTYTLVAVATPFNGVQASADCGHAWLHVVTLGASAVVCSMVSGKAWKDLPPNSRFIRAPGTLVPEVASAVGVITAERGICRRRAAVGECEESDEVFSIREQRNARIEADPRWERVEVAAGHDEIVGDIGTPPRKLFAVLEAERVLSPVPPRVARDDRTGAALPREPRPGAGAMFAGDTAASPRPARGSAALRPQ